MLVHRESARSRDGIAESGSSAEAVERTWCLLDLDLDIELRQSTKLLAQQLCLAPALSGELDVLVVAATAEAWARNGTGWIDPRW